MDLTVNSSAIVTIYRKTAKGHTEIETRVNRLPLRQRSVLIMVDGRTPDRELRKLAGAAFDAMLKELLDAGYVEPVATLEARATAGAVRAAPVAGPPSSGFAPSRPPVASAPVVTPVAAPGATPPAAPAAAPAQPEAAQGLSPSPAQLGMLRRDAVRHLTDQVGPLAESLAMKLESARSWAELRPLLVIGQQIIGNVRGRAAADAWRQRFIGP